MKRTLFLLISSAIALLAADFWTSKPFLEWSDKDVQKMMTDSPWAKKASVPPSEGPSVGAMPTGRGGGGRGGLSRPGTDDAGAVEASQSQAPGGGGAGGGGADFGGGGSSSVILRWYTSQPVKEAAAKIKYGQEATTSPEAKAFLAREDPFYGVEIAGFPTRGPLPPTFKTALIQGASLNVKGKDSVHATDVQIASGGPGKSDFYLIFPNQRMFTLEDGEIEFSAKVGGATIKQKFKLKDMVFNGKLEL